MRKRILKKVEPEVNEEEDDEEMSGGSKGGQKDGAHGRQDNSLSALTTKFIDLIKSSENATIDINDAVSILNVQRRRIYDITNVL